MGRSIVYSVVNIITVTRYRLYVKREGEKWRNPNPPLDSLSRSLTSRGGMGLSVFKKKNHISDGTW